MIFSLSLILVFVVVDVVAGIIVDCYLFCISGVPCSMCPPERSYFFPFGCVPHATTTTNTICFFAAVVAVDLFPSAFAFHSHVLYKYAYFLFIVAVILVASEKGIFSPLLLCLTF